MSRSLESRDCCSRCGYRINSWQKGAWIVSTREKSEAGGGLGTERERERGGGGGGGVKKDDCKVYPTQLTYWIFLTEPSPVLSQTSELAVS